MRIAAVGAQCGDVLRDAACIPSAPLQSAHCEGVAQIVQPWTVLPEIVLEDGLNETIAYFRRLFNE